MNWLQLVYQYGIGGLFFTVTLLLCYRQGASRENASDRKTLWICIAGFVGYLVANTAWILAAQA